MLKDTIAALAESRGDITTYKIAQHLAAHKPEQTGKKQSGRPDRYGSTVRRVMLNPESASWENVKLVLAALGVDAEAAIAIAASQVKQ
jgi:hypothetical protein